MSLSHARMACPQQPLAAPQTINIPNMANYSTALSSRLLPPNGHVLKTPPPSVLVPVHQPQQPQQQQVVQLADGQLATVISDTASKAEAEAPQQQEQAAEVPRTKGGREKRYPCPYCTWSGVDNWCLKRHLNTHLKPYVCALCDYKAARTERLQTHVLKVHNKRSCVRCSYMADDQSQLNTHLQEHHGQLPTDQVSPPPRQKRAVPVHPGRKAGGGASWASSGSLPGPMYQASAAGSASSASTPPYDAMNHNRKPAKRWRPRPQGAERLFNYMEASDSDEEEEQLLDLVCQQCGLEFLDSVSLQTHLMSMHRMTLCSYSSHPAEHMQKHATVEIRCLEPGCRYTSSMPGAMEEHSRLAHPSMPPLNQKCPHCGFVVLSGAALARHAKTHHLATVQCAACTRVEQRFDRHRSGAGGDMWSEEDQEDDEELMAAAAQAAEAAVNAIEDDSQDGEDGVVVGARGVAAGGGSDKTAAGKSCSDHEMALRVLRRQWNSRRSRVFRFRAKQRDLQSLLDSYPPEDSKLLQPTPTQLLRVRQVGRWLVRRRVACYSCPPAHRLTWPVHTAASLAAHSLWRHRAVSFPCDSCDARFRHRYQALLHASREHADLEGLPAAAGDHAGLTATIAEPIVTLTVPQYLTTSATATTAQSPILDGIPTHQLQQLDPQFGHQQLQQVYHTQVPQVAAADPAAAVHPQEAYTIDDTRITVVPVLYTCAPEQSGQQPQQLPQSSEQSQQQQFEAPMYNGMMVPAVPKQVWYPQLPQLPTPSYYISTQFPST